MPHAVCGGAVPAASVSGLATGHAHPPPTHNPLRSHAVERCVLHSLLSLSALSLSLLSLPLSLLSLSLSLSALSLSLSLSLSRSLSLYLSIYLSVPLSQRLWQFVHVRACMFVFVCVYVCVCAYRLHPVLLGKHRAIPLFSCTSACHLLSAQHRASVFAPVECCGAHDSTRSHHRCRVSVCRNQTANRCG